MCKKWQKDNDETYLNYKTCIKSQNILMLQNIIQNQNNQDSRKHTFHSPIANHIDWFVLHGDIFLFDGDIVLIYLHVCDV